MALPDVHYHQNDAFYPAHGRYHLFNTRNSWVNRQLKTAKLKPLFGHLLPIIS